jgi:ABC-type uncharacterized transport system permease subunit
MNLFFPYALLFLLYAALGFHFWRTRWHAHASGTLPVEPAQPALWEKLIIGAPLILHAYLVYGSVMGSTGFNLGVGNALSMIAWLTVLIYWLASFHYNMEGVQALILPVAAVCAISPALFPESHTLPYTSLPAFRAHLLISMLAYSLFTIAALHAALMALIERRLHSAALTTSVRGLPPLLTMETLLFRIIAVGFVLLTLTLGTGIVFSEELFGKPLQFNHKTVFAFVSWGIFAALLGGRSIYGWRGRTAVRWTLAGFGMLLLAYVGSKFVLEVILHRP